MKLFRRSFAMLMVLALMLSMTISVLAVDIATSDEFFDAYYNDETEFNLTDNVSGIWFEAQEGVNYTFDSEGGYALSDVGVHGAGSVEINTDINDGLYVDGDASVTVNGDVTGMDNAYTSEFEVGGSTGLIAVENATVVVNGNVTGGSAVAEAGEQYASGAGGVGVYENANVTVNGAVAGGSAEGAEENYDGAGIYAGDNGSAAISGDVDGDVAAYGESNVAISGSIVGALDVNEESSVSVGGDVAGEVDASGDSSVAVGGDINNGLHAVENSKVTVGGDVNGADGNPDEVDFSDSYGFSDGGPAVEASGNAVVEVAGNVSGGDGYGTYGYGALGLTAGENATVTVGGNVTGGSVTADPDTEVGENEWTDELGDTYTDVYRSRGGTALEIQGAATVTVGGNVAGGSTNGDGGAAGSGALVYPGMEGEAPTLNVAGAVTKGDSEYAEDSFGLGVVVEGDNAPSVTVGSYDTAMGVIWDPETGEAEVLTEENIGSLVTVTGVKGEVTKPELEAHFGYLLQAILSAKAGDEITTDIGARKSIPAVIIDAARKAEVKLTIKWAGGDDLVITKDFAGEVSGYVLLSDLAEMLKK